MLSFLDKTFATPEENIAYDEELLSLCDRGASDETFRFWESSTYFVVLGRADNEKTEVKSDECKKNLIPILRRSSGGGTVLQGPGCLNYSLIAKIDDNKHYQNITRTNSFIMQKHKEALQSILNEPIEIKGFTDLVWRNKKFSGNAQKRGRNALLFHGTFLYGMNIELIERYLLLPTKTPAYRNSASHTEFLTNLPLSPEVIKDGLKKIWT